MSINNDGWNSDLLACSKYLKADEPASVTSKDVKVKLKELGWIEGDPVPGGLAKYTKEVLKVLELPSSTKNALSIFNIEEVKVTLQSALRYAKKAQGDREEIQSRVASIVPNMESLSAAAKPIVEELAEQKVKSDLKKEAQNLSEHIEDEFESVGPVVAEQENKESISDEKYIQTVHVCPRCGLDLHETYNEPEIDEEDKNAFLYTVLGNQSFRKTYDHFNGKLKITLRSLTALESEMIDDQVRWDIFNSKIESYAQQIAAQYRYAICLSVVDISTTEALYKSEPIKSIVNKEFESENNTNLSKYATYVLENVIGSDYRRTLVNQDYSLFLKQYDTLRKEINNPNFWTTP